MTTMTLYVFGVWDLFLFLGFSAINLCVITSEAIHLLLICAET